MSSPPRYFQEGSYYHVYNRGNRKQNIFLQDRDYRRFLQRAYEYKEKFGVSMIAYCLMKNHFHFLLRQNSNIPISTFMLRLSTSYAKYFNIKYGEVGSLFQDRFKAKLVETDEYLLHLSRYIHQNPIKILGSTLGVERGLRTYRWSSYPAFLGEVNPLVDGREVVLSYFAKENPSESYAGFTENLSDGYLAVEDLLFD